MAAFIPFFHVNRRQPRVFRRRLMLDDLRDCEIIENYRLDRMMIQELTEVLTPDLESQTDRSQALHPITKVLIGLRYLGKADFLSEVAFIHGVSKPTAATVVDSFINAVNRNLNCIRFMDVVTKWPGSQHDAAIFNSCGLKHHLEDSNVGHVLGDSGYPLRSYVITPVGNPSTVREQRYNAAHCRGRCIVENAFGVLKARFRCLHKSGGCLPFEPKKCSKIVTACMHLHNICIEAGIDAPDTEEIAPQQEEVFDDDVLNDFNCRQRLIDLF